MKDQDATLATNLTNVLADDELKRALAVALSELSPAARRRVAARLGKDTGAAIDRVFGRERRGKARAGATIVTSDAKLRQEWDALWRRWQDVVFNCTGEEGPYSRQDYHWEQPYFDVGSIASDLEKVAGELRPLIPRVLDRHVADAFSFSGAITELEQEIGSGLPEWAAPGEESCELGPETTNRLLEWEWGVRQRRGVGAAKFVDELRDLETSLGTVALHGDTVQRFVLAMPEPERKAVLESIVQQKTSARWRLAFAEARGCWPTVLHRLSRRWQPALHDQIARAGIGQDWTLALPLIRSAARRKDTRVALELLNEAVRAMLRLEPTGRWEPRRDLLAAHRQRHDDRTAEVVALLRVWQSVAADSGDVETAAALALQATAVEHAEQGDVMLKAFATLGKTSAKSRSALFAKWREHFVGRALGAWRDSQVVPCGGWVRALVDAAADDDANGEATAKFGKAVRTLLSDFARSKQPARPLARSGSGYRHLDLASPMSGHSVTSWDAPPMKAEECRLRADHRSGALICR